MTTSSTRAAKFPWQSVGRTLLRSSQWVWRAGLEFALPATCVCCGQEPPARLREYSLCDECFEQLQPPAGPQCARCAAPVGPYLETAHGCIHCRQDKFHFERVIRLGVYRDQLRQAVLHAKSVTGEALTKTLADLLVVNADLKPDEWNCDFIVAVPHYWTRRFHPGHVASETLAERLSHRLGIPYDRHLLRKVRWTPAQAGSPPSVRRQQQRKAFAARGEAKGLRLLLVDDVLTTGATADEASKALLAAGARSVTVAVIARGIGEHA